MTIRPKIGNIIAVHHEHSYVDVKMKRSTYDSFHLATIAKVNRDGIVTAFKLIGSDNIIEVGYPYRVFVITGTDEQREGAIRLAKAVDADKNTWPDKEAMRNAILYAFSFGRAPA